jgi:hypothetical protein
MDVMDMLAQARPDSLDPQADPVRRAGDLARAVATPRAETAARPGTSPRRRVGGRVGGRAHQGRLIAIGTGIAALAGTAGAVVALSATGTPPARPQPAAARTGTAVTTPTPGELRNAILTAFNGVSGDVFYARVTETYSGSMSRWDGVEENWFYPLQPRAGQQVRARSMALPRDSKDKSNTEWFFTEPASARGQTGSTVPFAKTEMIDVEYGNRTWSDTTGNWGFPSETASLQRLREEITTGKFHVRKVKFDGRTVLELTTHEGTKRDPIAITWWVDPVTYLPLQTLAAQPGYTNKVDYGFLPPTPANIAKLKVTIPAGFTRTPTQKLP